MKLPPRPPDPGPLLMALVRKDPDRLLAMTGRARAVDDKGRYLHWDKFRFKKAPEGMSTAEAWALTRTARQAASQPLSLQDADGNRFTFCEPPALKAILRDLDMNTGGSLATALSAGEGRLYLARSSAEEPFASSYIEGAATTRQIAKKLIFEGRSPRTKDERMVLNNYHAMEFVKSHRDDPFSLPMLLELHKTVTEGTLDSDRDAGRVRTADDVRVVDETNNEILHQPPPASALPSRLEQLLKFANKPQSKSNWVHPLVRAFILHFMLAYEHPFVDGNGRVARALFYWAALREGYWLIEYVSISSVIAEAKIAYGKSFLHVETDGNDLTYFLNYHAKVLNTAIERLTAFVAKKRDEVIAFEKRLADRRRPDAFNHRESWLLNELARKRISRITISEHEKTHGVTYLTARSDLENLVDQKILQKAKQGRTSIYYPARDLIARLTNSD